MYVKKDGTALLVGKAKTVSDMSQGVGIIDGSWLMDTTGARYAKLKAYDYVGSFDEGGLARVGVRRRHRSVFDYVSIGWGWGGHWGVGFPGWGWGPLILAGAGAMQDTIIMDGAAAFLSFQGKSSIRRTFIWVPSISRGRKSFPQITGPYHLSVKAAL